MAHSLSIVRGANTLTLPAAWVKVVNLQTLWSAGPQRGQLKVRPGVAGRKSGRRYQDHAVRQLQLILLGDTLHDGSPAPTPLEGMQSHVDWIQSFCEPVSTAPYTLAASLTMPSGAVRTAGVQLELDGTDDLQASWGRCTLNVTILGGKFA